MAMFPISRAGEVIMSHPVAILGLRVKIALCSLLAHVDYDPGSKAHRAWSRSRASSAPPSLPIVFVLLHPPQPWLWATLGSLPSFLFHMSTIRTLLCLSLFCLVAHGDPFMQGSDAFLIRSQGSVLFLWVGGPQGCPPASR